MLLGLKHLLMAQSSCDVVHTSVDELPGDLKEIDILVIEDELLTRATCLAAQSGERGAPEIISLSAETQPDEVLRRVNGLRAVPSSTAAMTGHHWVAPLSPREQEVLQFIASGLTHDQVARQVGISRHTVDTYVKRVRSKFGVGNKAELTRIALSLKLV
ncbi:LuxR C-terminal-related transcriptional regulator [Streptomyces turgidiscabies]|uniref:Transcriptional regulator, LuxR family n=1 Tax=Streptomyces turgidiscabies (strain Car8) TaxID=698760 RepID=L7EST4_STRT8|nr:LuxR C-terminal-related transcriptional regulator [Streptomyces turgidiscabies]ELP61766.1 transcriptional regulator, LuxR family [Streptomyces turgidiscabies Car8]MDX3493308.1 LuxR C-terminal-related transcriptional regulator [Streptomyces turgidiscabies]